MKVTSWNSRGKGTIIQVSRQEALMLIETLAQQMLNGDGNSNRWEAFDDKGRYFSVSVDPNECDHHCPNKVKLTNLKNEALEKQIHKQLIDAGFSIEEKP